MTTIAHCKAALEEAQRLVINAGGPLDKAERLVIATTAFQQVIGFLGEIADAHPSEAAGHWPNVEDAKDEAFQRGLVLGRAESAENALDLGPALTGLVVALQAIDCSKPESVEAIAEACRASGLVEPANRLHALAVNTTRRMYDGPPFAVYMIKVGDINGAPVNEPTLIESWAKAQPGGYEVIPATEFFVDSLADIALEDVLRNRAILEPSDMPGLLNPEVMPDEVDEGRHDVLDSLAGPAPTEPKGAPFEP